jgi:hypothetical protein
MCFFSFFFLFFSGNPYTRTKIVVVVVLKSEKGRLLSRDPPPQGDSKKKKNTAFVEKLHRGTQSNQRFFLPHPLGHGIILMLIIPSRGEDPNSDDFVLCTLVETSAWLDQVVMSEQSLFISVCSHLLILHHSVSAFNALRSFPLPHKLLRPAGLSHVFSSSHPSPRWCNLTR